MYQLKEQTRNFLGLLENDESYQNKDIFYPQRIIFLRHLKFHLLGAIESDRKTRILF